MLWFHGGDLRAGSSGDPLYDGSSIAYNEGVIVASFNYRLGLGGFLASRQIAADLRKDGFDGNGNFGLTDQRVAAEWVQTYIEQFGGDRDNVCATGHSAGAISIGYLSFIKLYSLRYFFNPISIVYSCTYSSFSINEHEYTIQNNIIPKKLEIIIDTNVISILLSLSKQIYPQF